MRRFGVFGEALQITCLVSKSTPQLFQTGLQPPLKPGHIKHQQLLILNTMIPVYEMKYEMVCLTFSSNRAVEICFDTDKKPLEKCQFN